MATCRAFLFQGESKNKKRDKGKDAVNHRIGLDYKSIV